MIKKNGRKTPPPAIKPSPSPAITPHPKEIDSPRKLWGRGLKAFRVKFQEDNLRKKASRPSFKSDTKFAWEKKRLIPSKRTCGEKTADDPGIANISGDKGGDNPKTAL